MATDIAEALRDMIVLIFARLCIFFFWQTIAVVICNYAEAELTTTEMVVSYFKRKSHHGNKRPPSDQKTRISAPSSSTAPITSCG